MTKKLTPAQQQYLQLKQKYKDSILFFRMGDFYETFYEDAKICSRILDIALTTRDRNSPDPIPMAGVPYHSADKYIQKLVENWYKVAIAEQVGEVKPWQIVKREVVSVVTPGTYLDDTRLKDYNFIVSIVQNNDKFAIAFWDFSLWDYWTKEFENIEDLQKFLSKISPREIILDIQIDNIIRNQLSSWINDFLKSFVSIYDKPFHTKDFVKSVLNITNLGSYGKALEDIKLDAFALLLKYLTDTQKTSLKNINQIAYWSDYNQVYIDDITIKNLEIFRSSYEWSEKYSLYGVINKTYTPMWARYLKSLFLRPVRDINILNKRLDYIRKLFDRDDIDYLQSQLKNIWDINRLISTILYKKNLPSLWLRLKNYLKYSIDIANNFPEFLMVPESVRNLYNKINTLLRDDIKSDEIDYIADWVDSEIDALRKIAYHSDELLLSYQRELSEFFNIPVKIKYINNQWYFIEVSKKDVEILEKNIKEKVLLSNNKDLESKFALVRRQTLKLVERYISPYLSDIEVKILNAQDSLKKLEKKILDDLRNELEENVRDFYDFADNIWKLDVWQNAVQLIKNKDWVLPNFIDEDKIIIKKWRHPIIEEFLPPDEQFVSNDLEIGWEDILHIITWPNMWWKSTYLRQNAIILLLAHIWFPVPAKEAKIWLVDGIFARVWSWDILAKNQSTFMTEMIELSSILHNATSKSFIILDEIWRGTSTYDGMALARAILEYIVEKIKSKTLFATHYHELIELEWQLKWVSNWSVAVYETSNEIVFLKKIVRWWASKSYWIEVAKLAGLPKFIIEKAEKYLFNLEKWKQDYKPLQLGLFQSNDVVELKNKIDKLEKENIKLKKIIDKLKLLLDEL